MPKVTKELEIKEFAKRVERMCDFLLDKIHKETVGTWTRSNDLKVIEDLKEDAADIQFDRVEIATLAIDGLYDYVNGADIVPDEKK